MCDPDSAADTRYGQAPWERKTPPALTLGTAEPTQWVFRAMVSFTSAERLSRFGSGLVDDSATGL